MAKKQKLKTHRGAAKRFKKSGTGKIMRGSAFKRHILTSKSTKTKRHMRGSNQFDASVQIRATDFRATGLRISSP